jgi:hypothetical protein
MKVRAGSLLMITVLLSAVMTQVVSSCGANPIGGGTFMCRTDVECQDCAEVGASTYVYCEPFSFQSGICRFNSFGRGVPAISTPLSTTGITPSSSNVVIAETEAEALQMSKSMQVLFKKMHH